MQAGRAATGSDRARDRPELPSASPRGPGLTAISTLPSGTTRAATTGLRSGDMDIGWRAWGGRTGPAPAEIPRRRCSANERTNERTRTASP